MNRILLVSLSVALLGGCWVSPQPLDVTGPVALTSTGGGDLLVIGGRESLSAVQLCDGCGSNFQRAPNTVGLANLHEPLFYSLAGAQIPGQAGAVLVVGLPLEQQAGVAGALGIADARDFVDGGHRGLMVVPLPATPVAVAAADGAAFVVTQADQSGLASFPVQRDASGDLVRPSVQGRCTLAGGFAAGPIAAAPSADGSIFAVDLGTAGGVLRIPKQNLTPGNPACGETRLGVPLDGAGTFRQVKSLALSPAWVDAGGAAHPAGQLLMLVLAPHPNQTGPTSAGAVVFLDAASGKVVPLPPFGLDDPDPSLQPMEPITRGGTPIGATFLSGGASCASPPCIPLYVGVSGAPVRTFPLLAAVVTDDGYTYFIDVVHRRFVSSTFYEQQANPPALEPASNEVEQPAKGPTLRLSPPDPSVPGRQFAGWLQAGVTHRTSWSAAWHALIPGSVFIHGTVVPSGHGTLLFDGDQDYTAWQNDPVLQFGPGDIAQLGFALGNDGVAATCQAIVARSEQDLGAEFAIVAINPDGAHPKRLELAEDAGFNPGDACPGLAAEGSALLAGDRPWLISGDGFPLKRTVIGEQFIGRQERYDYPYDYAPDGLPLQIDVPATQQLDTAVAFTITDGDPNLFGTIFLDTAPADVPVRYASPAYGVPAGIFDYSTPTGGDIVFTVFPSASSLVGTLPQILDSQSYSGQHIVQ